MVFWYFEIHDMHFWILIIYNIRFFFFFFFWEEVKNLKFYFQIINSTLINREASVIGHLHGKCIDSPQTSLAHGPVNNSLKWFHHKNCPCFLNDNFSCIGRRWTMVASAWVVYERARIIAFVVVISKNWGGLPFTT